MSRNIKLLYCILGSAILAFINSSVFEMARLGMFPGGYGQHLIGQLIFLVANVVSLIGYILLIIFSILLIINNLNLKKD